MNKTKIGSLMIISASLWLADGSANPTPTPNWRGQSIAEFDSDKENEAFGWQIVNDGVMGGLSKGTMTMTDGGTLTFSGQLSLDNNGGFSTFRSRKVELNLSDDLGLLMRVKGDGRTYQARLATDSRYRGMEVSFSGEFKTTKGKWEQVKIPFADFRGSWRGRDLPDKVFDPANIQRLGILLADKNEGPFRLEIDWIRTYGKGQGNFTTSQANPPDNLIDTAVKDGRFTTLKKALDAAGLTVFFQWDNQLTVFAPTDEAFASLPEGTLDDLLQPQNKQRLISLLSHHVAPGANDLESALAAKQVETVHGDPLEIARTDGTVKVNGASIIDADVTCSDGIIHAIDAVLLP